MNDFPAIVTTPERTLDPVFWAIDNATVPGPVPLAPLVTVIHDTPEEDVQVHSPVVETVTGTVEGAAPTDTPLLESVVVQVFPV